MQMKIARKRLSLDWHSGGCVVSSIGLSLRTQAKSSLIFTYLNLLVLIYNVFVYIRSSSDLSI